MYEDLKKDTTCMILIISNGYPNAIYAPAESEFIANYFKDIDLARLQIVRWTLFHIMISYV